MSDKALLKPQDLVSYMKGKRITFNICSEKEAVHFLTDHTYYTKLSAYRKNYIKIPAGDNVGKYQHLDFAYLVDLSIIDMHMRYFILEMSLNIEHALKIFMINDATNNPDEDGYKIVSNFFSYDCKLAKKTKGRMRHSYCKDFYSHNQNNVPLWVLLEILSFGDLIRLYKLYFRTYKTRAKPIDQKILDNIRDIRNAAAHNNCVIYNLNRQTDTNLTISNILINVLHISKSLRKKYLKKQFTLDFTALLIGHKILVKSEKTHQNVKNKLIKLFTKRILRNKSYFKNNDILKGTYFYCIQLINHYFK